MGCGRFNVLHDNDGFNIISAGLMKVDGGCMFGAVPKADWERTVTPDRKNRITLGLNCLLLRTCGKTVLVDTGASLAFKGHESLEVAPSRLSKNLKGLGVTPKIVDIVILSNLQFDHCGGSIRLDRVGNIVPTFPNARYYVQSALWEEVAHRKGRYFASYNSEDLRPLKERGRLELMDGDTEILPGLHIIAPGGYAQGHQIVRFNHGGERIAFLGDLVPTSYHLDPVVIPAFDLSPQITLAQKREVLGRAEQEGWLLTFSHGHDVKAGYLQRGGGRSYLQPVDL
jgi:glyoxylase-like metal-dependent hydrolase (beta-lactamase superfamily II)